MTTKTDNRIKFLHYRAFDENEISDLNPSGIFARSGATVAYRDAKDGTEFATAYCHPRDNYNKAQGRLKATAHLEHMTDRRYEFTDDRNKEFVTEMDKVMFMQYGYLRG